MNIPHHLLYSKEHEWVKVEGDIAYIGITDYAQQSLGDIVFVELPDIGAKVRMGATFGVVESVKAASDLYSPISGTVTAINAALLDSPGLLNSDAYTNWLLTVKLSDMSELAKLLDAHGYQNILD
ncbi:MAG: glycine cleavage system protein GcvH [Firmicutes bacterium]|nr:glycine cleavage system protein GcvH [Dethiobacter sp.]MBS3888896.1 glycine cleavage system protein GcvH [Bacillota bacterium]MBS4055648.1 glycine cleavage system protein GcvH [Thermaerobacter sp.]